MSQDAFGMFATDEELSEFSPVCWPESPLSPFSPFDEPLEMFPAEVYSFSPVDAEDPFPTFEDLPQPVDLRREHL